MLLFQAQWEFIFVFCCYKCQSCSYRGYIHSDTQLRRIRHVCVFGDNVNLLSCSVMVDGEQSHIPSLDACVVVGARSKRSFFALCGCECTQGRPAVCLHWKGLSTLDCFRSRVSLLISNFNDDYYSYFIIIYVIIVVFLTPSWAAVGSCIAPCHSVHSLE